MWAQLITMRAKPGWEGDLVDMGEGLRAIEQPDSGLVRTTVMRNQKDPDEISFLVVFESEEKARAREQDPRRREGLQAMNAMMADMLDGPPAFVDLTVVHEWTP